MNIIVGDLCVSLVLFIYPKVIGTTNWCIFNCQIMLRILLASSCLYIVLVYHPKESINIHWSNRLSLMFMRMTVIDSIKTTLPKTDNAKEFMG